MDQEKRDHLEWSIRSRARNQACSFRLAVLFADHARVWQTKAYSRAAQDLTGVSFSLWRAAFLAEKTGKRVAVFAEARKFLERVLEDNAISYPNDKAGREWTFNYYTGNARSGLESLHKNWGDTVPAYIPKTRNSRERWDHCQDLFEAAVDGFEKNLAARKAPRQRKPKNVPMSAREKRNIVRKLTLEGRKAQPT